MDNSIQESDKEIVILLRHIDGNLLSSIIEIINERRKSLNEYDESILNLSRY